MNMNNWTRVLVSTGVVSLASVAMAEEQVMSPVLTAVSTTTISGYVDTSMIWKPGKTDGTALPGRFNDGEGRVDGFNLQAVGITLEKLPGEETWAAGYRVDVIAGPDAVAFNTSVGGADADIGLKQAYVNVVLPAGNGVDLKMGVFNTLIGYEVFESYVNPNFGRSYGWNLEPTQHTGFLASYDLNEVFSISGGVANTYSAGINLRSPLGEWDMSYMALIGVTAPDSWGFLSGSSLYGGFVSGFSGNDEKNTLSTYVGATVATGLEGLSVSAAFDYRQNGANDVSMTENYAWAIAGYVTWQATENMALNGRLDYTKGSDGTWYDGGMLGYNDIKNEMFALTGTLDYRLWDNVITRFEVRWDTCLSDDEPFGDEDENAFTFAVNGVYVF